MVRATGQFTIYDTTDFFQSSTAPPNPTEGMVWLNTSGEPPYFFFVYKGGKWERTTYQNLEELDPDQYTIVQDAYNAVTDLSADDKLTRYERSVVRGEVAEITGVFLSGTAAMPTITQIDANGIGALYSIRKSAKDLGIPSDDADFARLGTAYTSLRSYLSGMTPKAWDISSTATNTIVPATWDTKWKDYFYAYHMLNIKIANRQKEYTEYITDEAKKEAIAAVSNSEQYAETMIDNLTVIEAPVNTIALPSFTGRHVDSWEVGGRNLLRRSTEIKITGSDTRGALSQTYEDGVNTIEVTAATSTWNAYTFIEPYFTDPNFFTNIGAKYTLSADVRFTSVGGGRAGLAFDTRTPGGSMYSPYHYFGDTGGEWVRVSTTMTIPDREPQEKSLMIFRSTGTPAVGDKLEIRNIKLQKGEQMSDWSAAPEDTWATNGNRIRPITNPIFTSGRPLTLHVMLYGDGTANDELKWDTLGNAIKIKRWEDLKLTGELNWSQSASYAGSRQVKISGFSPNPVVDMSAWGVKYDGNFLETTVDATALPDKMSLSNADNTLYLTVSDSDSGWATTYTPTEDEIKAYFNGWKMCNGTFGTGYSGTGTKTWHPLGDTDLSRAVTTLPTDVSPSIQEGIVNHYQVVYQITDPIQQVVNFDGILELVQGSNEINVTYPSGTPSISNGMIKYATNIATATKDITHLIPTLQRRVSEAEEVITDDSIIQRVTSSTEYRMEMASKANVEDLGQYATSQELDDLSQDVDSRINDAVGSIDLTPFVTSSDLEQTTTDITAKFTAMGGINLLKNSVGYADTDNWTDYTSTVVETIANNELDTLGFGSGFLFQSNGAVQGISQTVHVTPGQPYTLSWYLNKRTRGTGSSHRFQIQILEGDVIVAQIADNSGETTNGYESRYINHIPQSAQMTVRFIGGENVDATLTGIMLNLGDSPLQWSMATGEVYNTNVRMDMSGLRVTQLDENGREIGYTHMTPQEFAGYYDSEGNGNFQKIFYLNGEETVTKKLRAQDELTMDTIKVVKVNNTNNKGWAFVPNVD